MAEADKASSVNPRDPANPDYCLTQRILRHLGVPTEIHEPRPARAPPLPFDARARHVGAEATAFDPC